MTKGFAFEVYTHFGRVLATFPVHAGETHHRAMEEARAFGLSLGHSAWWVCRARR